MNWKAVIAVALVAMNLFTFVLYGVDKRRAVKGAWRVSEKALLTCAACGGSVGALAAMNLFRHKTKHRAFTIGVPLMLILQIALAVFLWWKFFR